MSADGPLTFLFAPPDARTPHSAAKVHMRRLYDILQLCIARGDLPRARRAWAILARCHGFDWKQLWRTGVHLIDPGDTVEGGEGDQAERVEFLRSVLQQHPEEGESILRELVLRMIKAGRYTEALDQLDLYLPLFPYQENPILHIYAGLLSLYMAQPEEYEASSGQMATFNEILLRDSRAHFERALAPDHDNEVAKAWIEKITELGNPTRATLVGAVEEDAKEEAEEEDIVHRKKVRR